MDKVKLFHIVNITLKIALFTGSWWFLSGYDVHWFGCLVYSCTAAATSNFVSTLVTV